MQRTSIEYLTHTWNPVAMRCTPVSEGCTNCWHLAMAKRLAANPKLSEERRAAYAGGAPCLVPRELEAPLRRKKPAVIGVQFMGDLFHESLDTAGGWERIGDVWQTMCDAHQHSFLVLTKRPRHMQRWMLEYWEPATDWDRPLPNVLLGVTAENQQRADERIPILLQIPAAFRWVSLEPMLSAIDIRDGLYGYPEPYGGGHRGLVSHDMAVDAGDVSMEGMDLGWQQPEWQQTVPSLSWVTCGGETGPGARPMRPAWVRGIRDQCAKAGVPFMFKSWGEWAEVRSLMPKTVERYASETRSWPDGTLMFRVGKRAAGRLLDGVLHDEYPETMKHG